MRTILPLLLCLFVFPFISTHTVQIRALIIPNGSTTMYALAWEAHPFWDLPSGSMIIDGTRYRFTNRILAANLPRNTILINACPKYLSATYARNMYYQFVTIPSGIDWTKIHQFSFTRGNVEQEGCPEVLNSNLFVLAPIIESFTPTSACEGQTIQIFGSQFTNITSVLVGNSIALSYNIVNSTYATVVVGNETTSGNITLVSSNGSNPKSGFTRLASCTNIISASSSSSPIPPYVSPFASTSPTGASPQASYSNPTTSSNPPTAPSSSPIPQPSTQPPMTPQIDPPTTVVNGSCSIYPSYGLAFSSIFRVDCSEWNRDRPDNITYSLHFFDEDIQQNVLLFDVTTLGQIDLPLPPGYGSLYNLTVLVKILNATVSSSEIYELKVNVKPSTPLQLSSTLEFAKNNLQVLQNSISQGNLEKSQALLISMIQLLNRKDKTFCFNNCSNNGYCENGKCICDVPWKGTDCSLTPAQKEDRENIRGSYLETFLDIFSNTTVNTTDSVNQRNAYIVTIITSVPQELDSKVQSLAIKTIDKIAATATDDTSLAMLVKSLSNTISNSLQSPQVSPFVNSLANVGGVIGRNSNFGDRIYKEENLEVSISKTAPNSWNGRFVALTNSSVFVPGSVLPASVVQQATSIEVRTVLLKKNPYVAIQNKDIHSYVLDVKIVVDGVEFSLNNLNESIVLNIPGTYGNINICTFWNTTLLQWDTTGCKVIQATQSNLICSCNHATEFAGQTMIVTEGVDLFIVAVVAVLVGMLAIPFIIVLIVIATIFIGVFVGIILKKKQQHRTVHPLTSATTGKTSKVDWRAKQSTNKIIPVQEQKIRKENQPNNSLPFISVLPSQK